jgi:hypothetical protein
LAGAPHEQETTARDGGDGQAKGPHGERPVEERAEEIVQRVSARVARFARRLVALTREEVEDIVAEAQSIRRGGRGRE